MKLFSSYVLLLLGFISSVVASGGPLDIPDFLTEENTKCSDRMPKYDESGRELGSMERSLRGDWHRMPHPHNLPRIDGLPVVLLPLTSDDFLSFGVVHEELCWYYMTGDMVRKMSLKLDMEKDAAPYTETVGLGSVRPLQHTIYQHAGQVAGYWRNIRNPKRLIRIIIIKKKSGEVQFLTRPLTKKEREWTELQSSLLSHTVRP